MGFINFSKKGIVFSLMAILLSVLFVLLFSAYIHVSIDEDSKINQYGIRIFPIPAHDKIFISNENNEKLGLTLYNYLGIITINISLSEKQNILDVSDLSPGMYILRLKLGIQILSCKIVIQ